jgi:two-component system CheB/CheR fusion protein
MASVNDLFIVGIGVSAGGIEALEGLFRPMPSDTGMAFVVVSHLAPNKASFLDEIVGRFTAMPVARPSDGVAVEANRVYVIAPDTTLTLEGHRLRVRPQDPAGQRATNRIDRFFNSLAEHQGERAIGVVLSGGGSDGTVGIKAIKEQGGLTVAQGTDHSMPRHGGMPSSAIATGLVDIIAPVEEMAAKLVAYVDSFGSTDHLTEPTGDRPADDAAADARRQIYAILRDQVGHDFGGYKEKTFLRRVQRRMQVVQLAEVAAYIERLRQDPGEVTLLFRDLLIGVTNFFRDQEAFEALAKLVVPRLFEGKGDGGAVRVWVPGCATGEEVYSIAILLREHLETLRTTVKVQVFGTDIDEAALAVARAARYPAAAFEGRIGKRLRRYFTEDSGTYVVAKEVRDTCIFSVHSVVRDPPFSRIDLVSCRNLLIYLGAELQAQVVPVLHYALRPGGYLFLGIAESVTQHADLFVPLDKKHRIFQRRAHARSHVQLPLMLSGPRLLSATRDGNTAAGSPTVVIALRRGVDAVVLERFAPAHVVVTREGDVVYHSPRTGKYLEPPAGVPNRQILAMARKGLRLELRGALQQAVETRRPVTRENVAIELDHGIQLIDLCVEPMATNELDGLFLILFRDLGPVLSPKEAARARPSGAGGADVARLEADLRETGERLQSTIEQYETALEELKAANEELVSMNEELQSTNEELETTKEEIQSINEELQTVNQELGIKVDELNHVNTDLSNLFDSTEIAVVFLDRNMTIRSYTPAVAEIFSLIQADRGRSLTDIATSLDYEGLAEDVRAVVETGSPRERRITKRDRSIHYLMRILPYRANENDRDGALITFGDVTAPAQAEQQQRLLVHEVNHRLRNMLAVINAVAAQSLARAESLEGFRGSFMGRVGALARSHGLLARERWGDLALSEIVREELEIHQDGAADRIEQGGPGVALDPKTALTVGMIVHELGTNALKYGALSSPDGRLSVSWSLEGGDGQRRVVIRWVESGGPPVAPPTRKGFGSELIERQVRYDLGGTIDAAFPPEGLQVTLAFPMTTANPVGEPGAGAVASSGA